jgi:rhodanese-related sulfurtransferase
MAKTVDLAGVKELLGRGAQLVEVLPLEEYEELHLLGAIHLPSRSSMRSTPSNSTASAQWSSTAGTRYAT